MIYDDAKELMTALEVTHTEGNFEIALEVINKYGTYKRALQATIGIEFKKKEALLIALLGDEDTESKDEHTDEAKRLINLVRAINEQVFKDSQKMQTQFSDLIKVIKLDAMIDSDDLAVLNTVKPYKEAKQLITDINAYQDGNIQLQAFIDALKYTPSDAIQIANTIQGLRIKRWKLKITIAIQADTITQSH